MTDPIILRALAMIIRLLVRRARDDGMDAIVMAYDLEEAANDTRRKDKGKSK